MFCFCQRGAGEEPPAVPASGGKGHWSVPTGSRAGVDAQHQESRTEHAPDVPHWTSEGNDERGEKSRSQLFFKKQHSCSSYLFYCLLLYCY